MFCVAVNEQAYADFILIWLHT